MKVEKLESGNGTLKLTVGDANPAFVNVIRRISMNGVPVLAIEDVGIDENSSALFDEIVAQRLGQIPLEFDPEKFNTREECDCEDGCPNCEVKFSLEKEGPGTVYSGDLVCETADVEPLYDNIPITELDENQLVKLEATAILSTGKDHSKHQASIASYQYYPQISVDNRKLNKDEVKECVEVCPRNVFENEDGKLRMKNEVDCSLCKECVEAIESKGLEVEGDENKFIYKIESISALEPEAILERTTEIVEEKADKVIEKIG